MSTLNIGGDKADASYRYKMPSLICKIEGRGNGIKTVILNMTDVARALHIHPAYPTKFFGIELGAQSKFNALSDRAIVNGAHLHADLAKILDKFISLIILCPKCKLPELNMSVKSTIKIDCAACGYNDTIKKADKMTQFIIKNPPKALMEEEERDRQKGKKLKLDSDGGLGKAEVTSNGEDPKDTATDPKVAKVKKIRKGGKKKKEGSTGDDDQTIGDPDEEPEAQAQGEETSEQGNDKPKTDKKEKPEQKDKEKKDKKKKEKKSKSSADAGDNENPTSASPALSPSAGTVSAGPSAATGGSKAKKTKKSSDDEWETDTSEEAQAARREAEFKSNKETAARAKVDSILTSAKNENKEESPVTTLKIFLASNRRSNNEILAELKRISLAKGLDQPGKIKVLLEAVVDPAVMKDGKSVEKELSPLFPVFLTFTSDRPSSLQFIACVEELIGVTYRSLLPLTGHILKCLYDADVVEEEVLIAWYDSPPETSWLVKKEVAQTVRAKAKVFITWLKETEADDDDDQDDQDEADEQDNEDQDNENED